MTITAIAAITHDKEEYSRYYRNSASGQDLSIINAQVAATGTNGDPLWLALVASVNGRVIASQVGFLNNGTVAYRFNLGRDGLDADGIYRARRGTYTLVASTLADVMGLTAVSKPFSISPFPVVEFREAWLVGIPLYDERSLQPVVQGVSGVTGIGTRDVQRGGYTMAWNAASRTLSWENGPTNTVPLSGYPYTAILWPDTLDQTISVTIDPASMPVADASGYVLVDYTLLADSFLRSHIDAAAAAIESDLNVPLEPHLFVTDALADQYPLADKTSFAPTYDPNYSRTRPFRIQLPMRRVIKVHGFGGYQGGYQVLSIPANVVQLDPLNGIVNIVPTYSGQYPAPTAIGLGGLSFAGGYNLSSGQMPNYWQYAVTSGLDTMEDGNEAIAREAVFRRASINVLGYIGRARTDILAGENFSRDGGSLSRQFTNGQYGVYSDLILQHKEWLTEFGGRHLKEQLIGFQVSVAGA